MIQIRPMKTRDIPLGMRLKQAAGWNQLTADWRRCLTLEPQGCFVAELSGSAAGTTTACVFGSTATIALVLVDPIFRRRGVARALMQHTLAQLDAQGVRTVRLQATPLGEPLYRRFGFVPECTFARFTGTLPPAVGEDRTARLRGEWFDQVMQLDRRATGMERGKFLFYLMDEHYRQVRVVEQSGQVEGFLACRPGAAAWQLGPCIGTAGACRELLNSAWVRFGGQAVYIDIPTSNAAAMAAAEAAGLQVQRHLLQMRRGEPLPEDPDLIWATSGPEKC